MKVLFVQEYYLQSWGLGIEVWVPTNPGRWKRLELSIRLGPLQLGLLFGSRKIYEQENALLRYNKETV